MYPTWSSSVDAYTRCVPGWIAARQAKRRKIWCWNDFWSTSTRFHNQCLITISSLNVFGHLWVRFRDWRWSWRTDYIMHLLFSRMARTDTTSTSITYLFWELSRCPNFMKKLQAELDEAMTNSSVRILLESRHQRTATTVIFKGG